MDTGQSNSLAVDHTCLLCSKPGQFKILDRKSPDVWNACANHLGEVAKYATGNV